MLSPRKAIYPGSFDPPTRGHLEVAELAARLFDDLYVAVVVNPSKAPLLTLEERLDLVRGEVAQIRSEARLHVVSFQGLAVDLAREVGALWLVRGLRGAADATAEISMALSNRVCGEERIETLFLPAGAATAFISSTLVREIAACGGKLDPFVTPAVEAALRRKFAGPGRRASS